MSHKIRSLRSERAIVSGFPIHSKYLLALLELSARSIVARGESKDRSSLSAGIPGPSSSTSMKINSVVVIGDVLESLYAWFQKD